MNTQQFIEEVKNSEFAAGEFEQVYTEFQEYQKLAAQTLAAFSRVCEKNQIPYQLAWGSLLGAIRDGGQIPWDYDVDLLVPYKEKERLIEALKRDLDADYYFYCPEVDPKCYHFMMRIAPKGYNSDVLHVDVFYLVGAPEDPEERAAFARRIINTVNWRYRKLVNPFMACNGRLRSFVKLCLRRLKLLPVSLRSIEREYYSLCTKYDFDKATYYVTADSYAADATLRAEAIKPTMKYNTNDGVYVIPMGYDEILRSVYKDYTQILPLESRLREINGHYRLLKRYAKK